MKKFVFSLEPALRWREHERSVEQTRFDAIQAERVRLSQSQAELRVEIRGVSAAATSSDPMSAHQLAIAAAYRARLEQESARLAGVESECAQRLQSQKQALVEADRKHKLLTKLQETSRTVWQREYDRTAEQLVQEMHLAGVARRQSGSEF